MHVFLQFIEKAEAREKERQKEDARKVRHLLRLRLRLGSLSCLGGV